MVKTTESSTKRNSVTVVEKFLNRFMVWPEQYYSLVVTLWILHTFVWRSFSNLPYLNITATTKQSGKTLLLNLMEFLADEARNLTAITAAAMRRVISNEHPTVLFDEAEGLSGESASTLRQILATGYRKGAKVPFPKGKTGIEYIDVFCPKAFAMIGDIQDVIRDRSIVLMMRRSIERREEFMYDVHIVEGDEAREAVRDEMSALRDKIAEEYLAYQKPAGLDGREWDIWKPLFTICKVMAPERMSELTRAAADMAAAKTSEARKYRELLDEGAENKAFEEMYAIKLIRDMHAIFESRNVKHISTEEMKQLLYAIDAAPWRKFKGAGITADDIAALVRPLGVRPKPFRKAGKGEHDAKAIIRGYSREAVQAAYDETEISTAPKQ